MKGEFIMSSTQINQNQLTPSDQNNSPNQSTKKNKGCGIGCLSVIIVIAVIVVAVNILGSGGNSKEDKIDSIKDAFSCNKKLATSIYNASEECGMHAEKLTSDDVEKSGKYHYIVSVSDYTNVMLTYGKNKVDSIMTDGGVYVYTPKKHKQLKKYMVDTDSYVEVETAAQEAVKDQLKAPDTAKFKDLKVQRSGNTFTFTGTFSAQNSFGAQLTEAYFGKAKKDGDNYTVTECTLGE